MTETEAIQHQSQMATIRKEFMEWWNKHFTSNSNFQSLSTKMRMDFQAVAWQAFKAGRGEA
jgi:hypothetical protein